MAWEGLFGKVTLPSHTSYKHVLSHLAYGSLLLISNDMSAHLHNNPIGMTGADKSNT